MTLTTRRPLKRTAPLVRKSGLRLNAGAGASPIGTVPRWRRQAPTRPGLDIPQATRELLAQRSAGYCEAQLVAASCTLRATDPHHRKRRRDGGHAITNLVHLCRACHSWAHANPAQARELGLIVSVYEEPAAVPVRVVSRLVGGYARVLLLADGGRQVLAPGGIG